MSNNKHAQKPMNKYNPLWEFVQKEGKSQLKLSFDEIREILGMDIDYSLLNCKKELTQFGYQVGKISLKDKTVIFDELISKL